MKPIKKTTTITEIYQLSENFQLERKIENDVIVYDKVSLFNKFQDQIISVVYGLDHSLFETYDPFVDVDECCGDDLPENIDEIDISLFTIFDEGNERIYNYKLEEIK